MMTQLDYVIERCVTARDAGIPIVFLETDEVSFVDRLLDTEDVIPYWVKDKESKVWTLYSSNINRNVKPNNVQFFSRSIYGFFADCNPKERISYHSEIPQIIVCRNYQNDENSQKRLADLVDLYISASKDDRIKLCSFILQAPVVKIPNGLEDYVEIISVPALQEQEIKEVINQFIKSHQDEKPLYGHYLNRMIDSLRGFSVSKINAILGKIRSKCGCLSFNVYDHDTPVESRAIEIIEDEKRQMLLKSGLIRSIDGNKNEASGLDIIKTWVKNRSAIIMNSLEVRENWGIDAPKGVLISGIPGTGKSLLAQEVSRTLGLRLLQLDMGLIRDKYQGASEMNMRKVLNLAESLSPCVLWIDEIEKAFSGITGSGEADGGTSSRLFAAFLTWMQEKQSTCFVFATANSVSSIPPELLRRGRFDQKFYTFMPTKKECVEIFKGCIKGRDSRYEHLFEESIYSDEFLNDIIDYCGKKGKFLTGADIEGIVADAKTLTYYDCSDTNCGPVKYKKQSFKKYLEKAIDLSRPYGETNREDIAKCLLALAKYRFAPSSSNSLLDLSHVDWRNCSINDDTKRQDVYDDKLFRMVVESLVTYKDSLN